MAEAVTVSTPDGQTVSVPVDREDGTTEVESSWLEQSFGELKGALGSLAESLRNQAEAITRQTDTLNQIESRVPSNLTQMISDQQTTITALVGESLNTVRSLLTPPPPPPVEIPAPSETVLVESPPPPPPPSSQAASRYRKI